MNLNLDKEKVRLLLAFPFFAQLFMQHKLEITEEVPTAATDGVTLKINPKYWESLEFDERVGLLAHEVMHPAMLHHTRRDWRDPFRWNVAADFAINLLLKDAGVKLPEGGCISEEYRNMSAEEIYNRLPSDEQRLMQMIGVGSCGGMGEKGDGKDSQGRPLLPGWVEDYAGGNKDDENERQRANVIKAAMQAKMQGSIPDSIARFADELADPKVPWQHYLRRYVSTKARNDYKFSRRNYRYSHIYLPGLESDEIGEGVFIFDTSGSVTQELLNDYEAEINSIGELVKAKKTVIYCDSRIAAIEEFDSYEEIELEMKGGGGTDFRPPFDWLERNQINAKYVIYFTDGHCNSFPDRTPRYPVIWFVDGNSNFDPPFGEVVDVTT